MGKISLIVIATLTMFLSSSLWADITTQQSCNITKDDVRYPYFQKCMDSCTDSDSKCAQSGIDALAFCSQAACGSSSGGTNGNCQDEEKKITEDEEKFLKSCGDGSDSTCVPEAIKCMCTGYGKGGDLCSSHADDISSADTISQSYAKRQLSKSASTSSKDVAATVTRLKYCPQLAASELKGLKADYDSARKDRESKQKDVEKMTQEVSDLQAKIQNGYSQLQSDIADAKDKMGKQEAEAQKKNAEDIQKLTDDLKQKVINESQAEAAREANVQKVRDDCFHEAQKRLSDDMKLRAAQLAASQLSAGGQSGLFNSTGKTLPQKFDVIGDKYFYECIGRQDTNSAIKSITDQYNIAMKQIKAAEDSDNASLARIAANNGVDITQITKDEASAEDRANKTYQRLVNENQPRLNQLLGSGMNSLMTPGQTPQQLNTDTNALSIGGKGKNGLSGGLLNQANYELLGYQKVEDDSQKIYEAAEASAQRRSGDDGKSFLGDFGSYVSALKKYVGDSTCCPAGARCKDYGLTLKSASPDGTVDENGAIGKSTGDTDRHVLRNGSTKATDGQQ